MRNFRFLAIIVFLSFCVSADALSTQESIPDGWTKIDARGQFTFFLPQDMKLDCVEPCGAGSWSKAYRGDRLRLYTSYTTHTSLVEKFYLAEDMPQMPDYENEITEIDGRRARIMSARDDGHKELKYVVELQLFNDKEEKIIWMAAKCKDRSEIEVAKKIFRTIDFPD